jgi:hypothetical protein
VYLPLAELIDRTARQLDERRAATGRWQPDPELVAALYDDECSVADRLAQLLAVDPPLFKADKLECALQRAEKANEIVLGAEQRRAIATALNRRG